MEPTQAERRIQTVAIHGHDVRIKIGPHGAKPEHDDVVAVAKTTGRAARDISAEALERWRSDGGSAVQ